MQALKKLYDEASTKLKQPVAKPKEGEVKVDEKLRAAFIGLLAELADAEDSVVYVLFSNDTKLEKPKGADDLKSYWEVEDETVMAARKPGATRSLILVRRFRLALTARGARSASIRCAKPSGLCSAQTC